MEYWRGGTKDGEIGFPGTEDEETGHGEPAHATENAPLRGCHVVFLEEGGEFGFGLGAGWGVWSG